MTDSMPLDDALRVAKDRSARGNATRADWQRVADLDDDLAKRELYRFLRQADSGFRGGINPYERANHGFGIAIGFVLGCAVMMASWALFPVLRDLTDGHGTLHDIATFTQFLSTLFVPLGAWMGGRWSARRQSRSARTVEQDLHITPTSTMDDMLRAFESTQHLR